MEAGAIRTVRFALPGLLILVLVLVLAAPLSQAAPQRLSVGAGVGVGVGVGLSVLELDGLRALWGLTLEERVVRLALGVLEFAPRAGLGVRFALGLGRIADRAVSKFDTELLLNIPLRGARAYLGGGSGLLRYGYGYDGKLDIVLQLIAGLKKDLGNMAIFMDTKLLLVLQLSGNGPPFLPGAPLQFTPGVVFHF